MGKNRFLTVTLDEDDQQKLELVRLDMGAKTDASVVRFLLNERYKKILNKKSQLRPRKKGCAL